MRRVKVIAMACILLILSVCTASAAAKVLQYWMWDPEIKTMEQEMISIWTAIRGRKSAIRFMWSASIPKFS